MNRMIVSIVAVTLILGSLFAARAGAVDTNDPAFQRTWDRTDKPVEDLQVSRTWIWGNVVTNGTQVEPYLEAPNNQRTVRYLEKSRMEDNSWRITDAPWDVTNGLLVIEMIEGRYQIGDDTFDEAPGPANIPIAGDPVQPAALAPTYAGIGEHGLRDLPARAVGTVITERLDGNGNIVHIPNLAGRNVSAAHRVQVEDIDHTVASVFWDFMNASGLVWENGQYVSAPLFENPFYATGYPVVEAYWATVQVAGVPQDVLIQCFERRCLTYTPGNDPGWQVEAGNVGLHYYQWRYGPPPVVLPDPTATPTATVTPSPTATPSPSPTPGTTGDLQIEDILQAGTSQEHINIRNMQLAGTVNVEGWRLEDEDGNVFVFPDVTVKAGFYVTVWIAEGEDIIESRYATLYWGLGHQFWNPGEELIRLYDSNGMLVDVYPG
ncbi:MAG TPA: lamin tail domain-containing protein [Thermomicrobiales bacterium]|nr:lamin tail domain-containing protein [Thermomicrobiales bacterium]